MRTLDKAFVLAAVTSLTVLIAVSSCGDNDQREEVKPKEALEATIEKDEWMVTYYFDGTDQSDHLKGLRFQFLSDGGIIARSNYSVVNGIWTAVDARNGQLKFNMQFEDKQPLDQLDEEWIVVERTESSITLGDGSDNDGGRLTLEKV
jgi:hypothetical protein